MAARRSSVPRLLVRLTASLLCVLTVVAHGHDQPTCFQLHGVPDWIKEKREKAAAALICPSSSVPPSSSSISCWPWCRPWVGASQCCTATEHWCWRVCGANVSRPTVSSVHSWATNSGRLWWTCFVLLPLHPVPLLTVLVCLLCLGFLTREPRTIWQVISRVYATLCLSLRSRLSYRMAWSLRLCVPACIVFWHYYYYLMCYIFLISAANLLSLAQVSSNVNMSCGFISDVLCYSGLPIRGRWLAWVKSVEGFIGCVISGRRLVRLLRSQFVVRFALASSS